MTRIVFPEQERPASGRGRYALRTPAHAVAALLGLLVFAGCDSSPKAPALSDAPVYENEGFRFLVPEGWLQSAAATLPSGALEGEVLLTQYRMRTASQGATLEILCFDESPDQTTDLHKYHAGPSHGVQQWNSLSNPETVEIDGRKGERLTYTARMGNQDMIKEVVAFRRDNRIYSFIGLFWKADDKAREQLRRAVNSVIWTD
jgi:hypothetical protein